MFITYETAGRLEAVNRNNSYLIMFSEDRRCGQESLYWRLCWKPESQRQETLYLRLWWEAKNSGQKHIPDRTDELRRMVRDHYLYCRWHCWEIWRVGMVVAGRIHYMRDSVVRLTVLSMRRRICWGDGNGWQGPLYLRLGWGWLEMWICVIIYENSWMTTAGRSHHVWGYETAGKLNTVEGWELWAGVILSVMIDFNWVIR